MPRVAPSQRGVALSGGESTIFADRALPARDGPWWHRAGQCTYMCVPSGSGPTASGNSGSRLSNASMSSLTWRYTAVAPPSLCWPTGRSRPSSSKKTSVPVLGCLSIPAAQRTKSKETSGVTRSLLSERRSRPASGRTSSVSTHTILGCSWAGGATSCSYCFAMFQMGRSSGGVHAGPGCEAALSVSGRSRRPRSFAASSNRSKPRCQS
mmetsp:Transcript_56490/g.126185  ORF Transcript_56490/g.126185 Transcript_56490/m.126185 type:complete len:209 (-) Transcript_56490:420-1046(-)